MLSEFRCGIGYAVKTSLFDRHDRVQSTERSHPVENAHDDTVAELRHPHSLHRSGF